MFHARSHAPFILSLHQPRSTEKAAGVTQIYQDDAVIVLFTLLPVNALVYRRLVATDFQLTVSCGSPAFRRFKSRNEKVVKSAFCKSGKKNTNF